MTDHKKHKKQDGLENKDHDAGVDELQSMIKIVDSKIAGHEAQCVVLEREIDALNRTRDQGHSEEDRALLEQKRKQLRDVQQVMRAVKEDHRSLMDHFNELRGKTMKSRLNALMVRRDKIKNILVPDAQDEIECLIKEGKDLDREIVELASELTRMQK